MGGMKNEQEIFPLYIKSAKSKYPRVWRRTTLIGNSAEYVTVVTDGYKTGYCKLVWDGEGYIQYASSGAEISRGTEIVCTDAVDFLKANNDYNAFSRNIDIVYKALKDAMNENIALTGLNCTHYTEYGERKIKHIVIYSSKFTGWGF